MGGAWLRKWAKKAVSGHFSLLSKQVLTEWRGDSHSNSRSLSRIRNGPPSRWSENFAGIICPHPLKGNREFKYAENTHENGPKNASSRDFSLLSKQVLTEWRRDSHSNSHFPFTD